MKGLRDACPTLDKESVLEDTEAEERLGKGPLCGPCPLQKAGQRIELGGRAGWEPRTRDSRFTGEHRAKTGHSQGEAKAEAEKVKAGDPRSGNTKRPAYVWVAGWDQAHSYCGSR